MKQSLERLELTFILKRDKQHYSFRVPLFEKMVRQQDPGDLLGRELIKPQRQRTQGRIDGAG